MKTLHYLMVLLLLLPSLATADFFWVAVLAKGSGIKEQRTLASTKLENLTPLVTKAWREGYVITDISHSPRRWLAILSKGTKVKEQLYTTKV